MPVVQFDWLDPSTWKALCEYDFPGGETFSAVYLMEPLVAESWVPMNAFIDYAQQDHRVSRFVLVAGSSADPSRPGMGQVWQHLLDLGSITVCCDRVENLAEEGPATLIREQGKNYTACGEGKIPFVSGIDIAAVTFHALTSPASPNCDYRVLGPELLTYDEVASKLTAALRRPVKHVCLSGEERYQALVHAGCSDYYARFLVNLETAAATGFETRMNATVEEVIGRPPRTLELFASEHRSVWYAD
ncbi:uncharacterized protein BO97DRAFT_429899 [Aspergillus homomorphus CBS 101889]|uniref:Uncharacterized protein n=1 Tax=Aspergillus homomorphus (strain CBS 101889) TaxID=1450537 RepID=A0A395HI10_ASPHC|nr:hypothetical protein BO97DRAFT_429899 [Aspergillus homomorphus CBS 101889]RAL06805.1 hypothetical protein BO97DRAFT_429899 [Aspergillus homomorphus CBS 101889]